MYLLLALSSERGSFTQCGYLFLCKKRMKRLELEGKRFGRLIVLKFEISKNGYTYWKCKCDCGNYKVITGGHLTSNQVKSCGCLAKEMSAKRLRLRLTKHGMGKTLFYKVFSGIIMRCNNIKNRHYKDYGGRGIKCLWNNFEEFKNDMYESYLEHKKAVRNIKIRNNTTIERTDNNGNYCKENCKWVTQKEQGRNRRTNHLITYKGKTKILTEWAEDFNMNFNVLWDRIKKKWSIEEALITPVLK